MLLRVAESTGEFEDKGEEGTRPAIVMVRTFYDGNPNAT
jgi:hypothetical protein